MEKFFKLINLAFKFIALLISGIIAFGSGTCSLFLLKRILESPRQILSGGGLLIGGFVLISIGITWFTIISCIGIARSMSSKTKDNKEKEKQ